MSDKRGKLNIGLYGGSFDPVHKGHVRVAHAFLRQMKPEKLIVMPCRIPPHKDKTDGAGGEARLRMLRAAFAKDEKVEISDFELKKDGVSYTVETLRELKKQYPDRNILLVVGADMFLTLREWKEAAEIMALCEPCVYDREHSSKEIRAYAEGLKRDFGTETRFIKGANVDLSSTVLRSALSEDKPVGGLIPKAVRGIIDETGVYRSEEYRLKLYRCESERLVEEKRFNHILRVEKAAVALAEHYGADVYKARAAALLHDVTKRKTHEEQLNMAREFGIIGAEEFDKSPKVAHAFTASAYAEHRFLISDSDLLNAIRYHTTGRAGMSLLEKIIFLADGIEEGRVFDGVEEIRRAAFEDIDLAMLISLEKTKEKVDKSGAYLHPYTAEAIAFFRDAVKN
ncbi:MAG: nicotinate (nicotinamide) nucleotide adenylyltransferase [Clostridia bacterium]|nr:nicotinate (nicotinamide) nucleotide adenylyltransferase [Clostridia bacterium]